MVTRKMLCPLTTRVIIGFIAVYLQVTSLKLLPLVLTSISSNTVPLITAVLSYFILKEKLGCFEIVSLGISLAGVSIIVVGHMQNTSGK